MSTRSGKRIHNEETVVPKLKKPKNYVSFPTDDEDGYVTANDFPEPKSTRKSKKTALKELDTNVRDSAIDDAQEGKRSTRVTRQTRRFGDVEDGAQNVEQKPSKLPIANGKAKNKKKKKSKNSDVNENINDESLLKDEQPKASKKSKKKKKKVTQNTAEVKPALISSNFFTDSFHSAAGSLEKMDIDESLETYDTTLKSKETEASNSKLNNTLVKISKKKSSLKTETPEKNYTMQNNKETEDTNIELNKIMKKIPKKKSSLKPVTLDKNHTTPTNKDAEDSNPTLNNTLEKNTKTKSSSQPETLEQDTVSSTLKDVNTTYEKKEVEMNEKMNTTFEKEPKAKRSLRPSISVTEIVKDTSTEKVATKYSKTELELKRKSLLSTNSSADSSKNASNIINTTFEKPSEKKVVKPKSFDSTFDKSDQKLDTTFDKSDPKLNTTYEKIEPKTDSQKSSLISSDNSELNVTFNNESSRISITSDESKSENIVNTTPVLIESSMEESHSKISQHDLSPYRKNSLQPPITPMKREGTFTKESPEAMVTDKTPNKRMTLPSPGVTPYHVTRSSSTSQKERSVLNVTRSIEKSHRSSLAEVPHRQTRVMFCSPMDNPVAAMQQKRKIIKSSMKGSNKSFVFDESASSSRPPARKRSFSHGTAEQSGAKRKRLADGLQDSVDRLSRPRTSSASAKLQDATPSKSLTPTKAKSDTKRTKLPNFAALHQKQFDKMESLGECQERKLKRARKLMLPKTPCGAVTVLDRRSPRGTTEKSKQKQPEMKPSSARKSLTFSSEAESPKKLPTLESLRPGYTKFGFKLNTTINPFSVPSKNDTKMTEMLKDLTDKSISTPMLPIVKPVQVKTVPSLKGGTMRKEAAKQTVMREKSFTSGKRDVKRNEYRTIIKGVRTNRRFELQMKMRNID